MKKTLVAMILMCGSAFAQYPNSAGAGPAHRETTRPQVDTEHPQVRTPRPDKIRIRWAPVSAHQETIRPQVDMGCPPARMPRPQLVDPDTCGLTATTTPTVTL